MERDHLGLLVGLDPEQRDVATSQASRLAVIAGAGTGKTRAITHRIAYNVAERRFVPRAILALTFTTKAAGELRGRLRELGLPRVSARTFHSAALRQARHFWPQAMGSELPEVVGKRLPLVSEAAGRCQLSTELSVLRDLSGEISWAKVSNVAAADYPQLATAAGREVAGATPEQVAAVFARYEEAKRRRSVIDYEDILLCAALLLADHPGVAAEVRGTYRHLVVDEYQDVSPLQERLLELWLGPDADLCVVGDPAQTIHSFAGARASYLTDFSHTHPGAQVIRLVRDYRSTEQIVALANRVSRSDDGVSLIAQGGTGVEPEFSQFGSEQSEATSVAEWIEALHDEGVPYREQAILYRINAQSPSFEAALTERSIPYQMRDADGFYTRQEVRLALRELTRRAARSGTEPAEPHVREILGELGWTATPPASGGAVRERWESLAALAELAFSLMGDESVALSAIVSELQERADAQQVPQPDGVTLSTLHSAKGLEWDAVALVGVQEGLIPFSLAQRPEQVAEERRLLYVGITRARTRLRVSWCRSRNGNRGQSRFLGGIAPTASPTVPRSRVPVSAQRSRLCAACGEPLVTGAEQKLRRHTACPSAYDPYILELLLEWRRQVAAEQSVPAYVVFTDATLMAAVEAAPMRKTDLLTVPGIGQTKLDRYGDEVMAIIAAGRAKSRYEITPS